MSSRDWFDSTTFQANGTLATAYALLVLATLHALRRHTGEPPRRTGHPDGNTAQVGGTAQTAGDGTNRTGTTSHAGGTTHRTGASTTRTGAASAPREAPHDHVRPLRPARTAAAFWLPRRRTAR